MIYVTHDQVEAMTMGERIVGMKDGVVQQIDAPIQMCDPPLNKFMAGFIGTPQMNFFDGQIRATGATLTFESSGGLQLPVPQDRQTGARNFPRQTSHSRPAPRGHRIRRGRTTFRRAAHPGTG